MPLGTELEAARRARGGSAETPQSTHAEHPSTPTRHRRSLRRRSHRARRAARRSAPRRSRRRGRSRRAESARSTRRLPPAPETAAEDRRASSPKAKPGTGRTAGSTSITIRTSTPSEHRRRRAHRRARARSRRADGRNRADCRTRRRTIRHAGRSPMQPDRP